MNVYTNNKRISAQVLRVSKTGTTEVRLCTPTAVPFSDIASSARVLTSPEQMTSHRRAILGLYCQSNINF